MYFTNHTFWSNYRSICPFWPTDFKKPQIRSQWTDFKKLDGFGILKYKKMIHILREKVPERIFHVKKRDQKLHMLQDVS